MSEPGGPRATRRELPCCELVGYKTGASVAVYAILDISMFMPRSGLKKSDELVLQISGSGSAPRPFIVFSNTIVVQWVPSSCLILNQFPEDSWGQHDV